MKGILNQYAEYNSWAHQRLLQRILQLTPEQHHEIHDSSFNGLYKTVKHVFDSESIWLSRLHGSPITSQPDIFDGSMKFLADALSTTDQAVVAWVRGKNDQELGEQLTYKNLRGEEFHQPYYLLLSHMFNHSTYHNGQLVTLLHQVSADNIPATDFIVFTRL